MGNKGVPFLSPDTCALYAYAQRKENIKEKVVNNEFKSCSVCGSIENCTKELTKKILTEEYINEIQLDIDEDLKELSDKEVNTIERLFNN